MLQQALGQGAVERAGDGPLAAAPDHQGGNPVMGGMVEQRVGDGIAMQHLGIGAQATRQGEGAVQFGLPGRVDTPGALYGDHAPGRVTAFGKPPASPHQVLRVAAAVDGDQHPPAQGQTADALGRVSLAQVVFDMVSCGLHGQFAQRRQVGRGEETLQRLFGHVRQVDLALVQALDQLARRQVDQADVAQPVEHRIGHRLADPDAGDAVHDVVEAFQVLDVHRAVDVDALVQQFQNVLPAPFVAAAGCVAMGQFVDQHDTGLALYDGIQVHLVQPVALVLDLPTRDQLMAVDQRRRFTAPMGFHHADHQVDALPTQLPGAGQHGVGLAHARRRAEKQGQVAAVLAAQFTRQGIGTCFTVFLHTGYLLWASSRARLSNSTLTRGSPNNPHCRPSV